MIGPILKEYIIMITNHRDYVTYKVEINEEKKTGVARVLVDGEKQTILYNAETKKWVQKARPERPTRKL